MEERTEVVAVLPDGMCYRVDGVRSGGAGTTPMVMLRLGSVWAGPEDLGGSQ